MASKDFFSPSLKKIIFLLVVVTLIEVWIFGISSSMICELCAPNTYCPPCVSYENGFKAVLVTSIPVVLIVYFLICLISYLLKSSR